ncbi:ubiquitin carboxyl-terminal hydrolase 10 [Fopius arisanus]|uniref:ubiquitinyl hydrolase 1 n=1 Tax=Fopius arisanus TaxID=64838 RepID=A0A9R1TMC9_9HYME|nr:PREDICTED: ubiquitin carboxyl-terminal hydrolase 10 [Fopius arisanus]
MGINMDIKSTLDYEFINLDNLDDNVKSEIRTILKTEIASDVLKLPWDNGEKDYNSNSVVPEMQPEVQNHWQQPYDDSIPSYEVATPPALLTPPMSTIAYPGAPLMQMSPYQDWQMSTAYPTTPTDPTTYTYVSTVPYPSPIYNPQPTEVLTTQSPVRDNQRPGRQRNRKTDNYNRPIANDMQPPYMMQSGQFSQIQAICHPGVPYLPYVSSQQHATAGRPIFIPQPQYSQIHHNSHQYHQLPTNYHPHSPTVKHQRQNAQNYNPIYNQGTKNDKKIYESQRTTATQSFRQALNHKTNNNYNDNVSNVRRESAEAVPKSEDKNFETIMSNGTVNETKCEGEEVAVVSEIKVEASDGPLQEVKIMKELVEEEEILTAAKGPGEDVQAEVNGEKDDDSGRIDEIKDVKEVKEVKEVSVGVTPAAKTFASILKSNETKNHPNFTQSQGFKLSPAVRENADCVNNGVDREEGRTEEGKRPTDEHLGEAGFGERKSLPVDHVQTPLNHPSMYRMGEFLLHYQMDKQTVSLLPRGLTNRSNYCYINSILQALLACPPFYNLLRALPRPEHPLKNSSTPLIDNMVKFVYEFLPLPEGERLHRKDRGQKKNDDSFDIKGGTAFEPSYVYTMLKNTSSPGVFSIEGRQEDAEEFLSCLLNGISDEMLELMKQVSEDSQTSKGTEELNVNYNSGDEEWKVMGPKNKGSITRCTEFARTPLSDIFRGQLRSRILRQGDQSTDNVQPFFTLQLDIEKAESVRGALEILVGKDQVEGMTCSKTKQQIQAWKQVTLEELPVILILHLKWFDYKLDGCSKIFKNVAYSIDLKIDGKILSPNATKKLTVKQKQYKLFAVTYHDGKEATKGHYLTDAFHVGFGAWVRYDDSSVKGISENDVLNPSPPRVPYLLYYRRCDTIGNQPNNTRTR